MRKSTLALVFALLVSPIASLTSSAAPAVDIMPMPAKVTLAADHARLTIDGSLTVALAGVDDARLRSAASRMQHAIAVRTGIIFSGYDAKVVAGKTATLVIDAKAAAPAIPTLGEDESYTLNITAKQVTLTAPTTTGALRGLATLTQLVQQDANGFFWPACSIEDAPRFVWRGLMLDVSRRWHPINEVKRVLDGMELVKLNVFHFHLSDDQGFRIESKTHPELQEKGSDGLYFTQDQVREIIAYAAERGIRVVPEFDVPGHASAWSVSHPELMSGKPLPKGTPPTTDAPQAEWDGTYRIERTWGIFDMVFDPTSEGTYKLMDDVLGEMADLFPDPYFHIGGDENNGAQWNANQHIQDFIKEHNLKDNAGIHTYFNNRIAKTLIAHGKKLQGWDEILHPTLDKGSLIQSWRGPEGVEAAATAGFDVILSNGYYIDLAYHASDHYLADPVPANTKLTTEQQKHVLGGEATMWSEWTTSDIIDSRIWPRTAAIAERLWSPQSMRDVADMYRRLDIVSLRLDEYGMQHLRNRTSLLLRLAGDRATNEELLALRIMSDAMEPVKGYRRGQLQTMSQFDAQGHFIDTTYPDSKSAREFNNDVAAYLAAAPGSAERSALVTTLRKRLESWHNAAHVVAGPLAAKSPRLGIPGKYIAGFAKCIHVVDAAIEAIESGKPKDAAWLATSTETIDQALAANAAAVEAPAINGFKQLIEVAAKSK